MVVPKYFSSLFFENNNWLLDYYFILINTRHFLRVTQAKGLNTSDVYIIYHLFFPRRSFKLAICLNLKNLPGFTLFLITSLFMHPFPGEHSKKTIDRICKNLREVLKREGALVDVIGTSVFDLYDTNFKLAEVSGEVSGEVYYQTSNPPVHSGCLSWPGYLGIELNVPDERYPDIKRYLRQSLHPIRSILIGF